MAQPVILAPLVATVFRYQLFISPHRSQIILNPLIVPHTRVQLPLRPVAYPSSSYITILQLFTTIIQASIYSLRPR